MSCGKVGNETGVDVRRVGSMSGFDLGEARSAGTEGGRATGGGVVTAGGEDAAAWAR
jgi:hypothetical protein